MSTGPTLLPTRARRLRTAACLLGAAFVAIACSHQAAETNALESGILTGLEGVSGIPVVGAERSDSDISSIDFFINAGVTATVDSVDLVSGRVGLVYALNGSQGNYGIKATADRLLPGLRHPRPPAFAAGSQP